MNHSMLDLLKSDKDKAPTMTEPLFCAENLRVAYPIQSRRTSPELVSWAVNDVSFTLQPGEKLGLVGESGCGKSTLGRAAMRLLPTKTCTEGRVTFQGKSVFDFDPEALRKFRGEAVALIFQDPMTRLDPLMTIAEHCLETLKAHQSRLSDQQAKTRALETLEAVNIPANRWMQYPHEFSGGMRQRVAIALALLLNPKLIVADEPTTSLDVTVSAKILQELTRLCSEREMALLLISHDLAMVGEYCDRMAVMNQGKIVEMGPVQEILHYPQHSYTQSLMQAAFHLHDTDHQAFKPDVNQSVKPLLRLQKLQKHYTIERNLLSRLFHRGDDTTIRAVDDINLEIFPGEILGLVGESGCGKSTLSRTILQLIPATGGHVEFLGTDLTHLSRADLRSQRRHMQMVFQDPHACLNPRMTIGESIADPLLVHGLASSTEAEQQVKQMLERVGLTPVDDYYHRYPKELSGGQQQRVAISRALITRPKLVICDEPVSMLDASVQTQVLKLMLELKQELNLTYLFITHDLWVARFLCDRIAVMTQGNIVELGPTQEIFNHPQHSYTQSLLSAAPLLARL
jgi:peptide/nickel transport system ATP-binding protein